jgi:hypothetical protein
MEMTRRKFIEYMIKTAAAIAAGAWFVAEKVVPRRFIRAVRCRKYPGRLKQLADINNQSKWSG